MNLLFSKFKSKNLCFKNRLVMPPMATSKCPDGKINQSLLDYYDEKSKGGYIGLIITEHSYVSPEGKASSAQVSIASDDAIEGFKKLCDVIHQNGSKIFAQISHAGMMAKEETTGFKAIAPSSIENPKRTELPIPEEMTKKQIELIKQNFIQAAVRVKKAGCDGVEIHSAHGYLLNQFYSPLSNYRTDEYGGTLENRIRLHLEIIEGIRKELGPDYPIALRLGACDYTDHGSTIDDAVKAAKLFEKTGVDLLDISGGFNGYIIPNVNHEGYFSNVTETIKQAVNIPVICTGGILDPEIAETLLKDNKADLIGVGRAILKDSLWPKTAFEALSR